MNHEQLNVFLLNQTQDLGVDYVAPLYRYGYRRQNNYKSLEGPNFTVPSTFTLMCWVRPNNNGDVQRAMFAVSDGTRDIRLRHHSGTNSLIALVKDSAGGNNTATLALGPSGINVYDDEEHFCWLKVYGTTMEIGIDAYGTTATQALGGTGTATGTTTVQPLLGNNSAGTQQYTGGVSACMVSRNVSNGDLSDIYTNSTNFEAFEGDADGILMPRSTDTVGTVASSATINDAFAGTWAPTAGGTTSGWLTEDGSKKSRIVITCGQSNGRVPNITYGGAGVLTGVVLGDPAQLGGTSIKFTDWASNINASYPDGPEVAMVDAQGVIPRILVKQHLAGTDIASWISTNWQTVLDFRKRFGIDFTGGGLIWLQGEADSKDLAKANAYATNLATLIADWKSAGISKMVLHSLPPITATGYDYQATVNSALSAAAAGDSDIQYVDDTDLTLQGDNLHIDAASCITRGDRSDSKLVTAGIWDNA